MFGIFKLFIHGEGKGEGIGFKRGERKKFRMDFLFRFVFKMFRGDKRRSAGSCFTHAGSLHRARIGEKRAFLNDGGFVDMSQRPVINREAVEVFFPAKGDDVFVGIFDFIGAAHCRVQNADIERGGGIAGKIFQKIFQFLAGAVAYAVYAA